MSFPATCDAAKVSNQLKSKVDEYFTCEEEEEEETLCEDIYNDDNQAKLIGNEVRQLIQAFPKTKFNGRIVARIFHGIESPAFPAIKWCRECKYWRAHLNINFDVLVNVVNNVLLLKRRTIN